MFIGISKFIAGFGGAVSSVILASFGLSGQKETQKNSVEKFPSPSVEVSESKKDLIWKEWDDEYQKSYLSELDKKLRFVLSVDSIWGWRDILRVNKRSTDEESVKNLMDQCRQIYTLPKSSLTDEQKEGYYKFVKFNCQWPKTSGRKFKEQGLNYVEKSRDIYFNYFAPKNPRFWDSVVNYNNLKNSGNKTDVEKYRFYCDKFPTFQTTEEGYTVEELDYMEFCWSQRLK